MIELTFSEDTNFLSVKKPINLSSDTIAAITNENILSTKQQKTLLENNTITQDTLKYMAEIQYSKFRIIIQELMTKNDISLIEYSWLTALELFCHEKHLTSAFLYIGGVNQDKYLINSKLLYWSGNVKKMELTTDEDISY